MCFEISRQLARNELEAVVAEREECAKEIERLSCLSRDGVDFKQSMLGKELAAAIRARTQDD